MKVILIAGSYKQASTSTQLLRYMAAGLIKKGVAAEVFDLRQRSVPLYFPDHDGTDPNVQKLLQSVGEAKGIVLGTPEYHSSLSGVLKNALDYLGKTQFAGKPVLSVSSSAGAVGVSSLTHLQGIVRNLHGINCPEWISMGGDQRSFTPEGAPESEVVRNRVDRALDQLIFFMNRL